MAQEKQKKLNRDEKARAELKQKVMAEQKVKIDKAIEDIAVAAAKLPVDQKPYQGMDVINKVLDIFECKTVVIHQPQIVPLSDEEKKQKNAQKVANAKWQEDIAKEQARRDKMPAPGEAGAPKSAAPVADVEAKQVKSTKPEITQPEASEVPEVPEVPETE